jgi:hypothetical protein
LIFGDPVRRQSALVPITDLSQTIAPCPKSAKPDINHTSTNAEIMLKAKLGFPDRVGAYRACIVMAWNIAYAHLLDWILKDQVRLDKFNAAISRRYQNLKTLQISKYDDFGDNLQERQVLEIANTANLYNSGIFKVLKDKLDRRNNAAHPSNVICVQSQADDMITDLVHNVVLALV